jgi:hypothetical protein
MLAAASPAGCQAPTALGTTQIGAQISVNRAAARLRQRYIRRGTHRSTRQFEEALKHSVKVNNADPKPFVWSKSADDILASVERFCLRTSNSRH